MNRNWVICHSPSLLSKFEMVWEYVEHRYHLKEKPRFYLNKHKSNRVLGLFTTEDSTPTIILNSVFLNNTDKALNTIIHEMCHFIAYKEYGRHMGHRAEWRIIGRDVGSYFGEEITRCSRDDELLSECTPSKKLVKKFQITCEGCGRKFFYKRKMWWMNLSAMKCHSCWCPTCKSRELKIDIIK